MASRKLLSGGAATQRTRAKLRQVSARTTERCNGKGSMLILLNLNAAFGTHLQIGLGIAFQKAFWVGLRVSSSPPSSHSLNLKYTPISREKWHFISGNSKPRRDRGDVYRKDEELGVSLPSSTNQEGSPSNLDQCLYKIFFIAQRSSLLGQGVLDIRRRSLVS